MPTLARAWIKALIICCAAGLAAVIVVGASRPVPAEASVRAPLALAAPSPAPPGSSTPAPGGSPTPSTPTPQPTQSVTPAPTTGSPGCGLFDVACKVKEAINGFFRGLVTSALNPVFRFLARSILASPRVDQMPRVHSLWTTSVWIANTSFVLLVVLGGMLIMGHQSVQTSYTVKDIAPRLVIAMVAANANLLVIRQVIDFANALSAALMGGGVDPGQAANTLKGLVVRALTDGGDLFMPLLALAAVVLGLIVLFTFTIRVMLLVLLTAAAPLALACHALPQTEGIARLWWRAIAGVLAIQVAQSLVLATALRVFFTSDQADLFGFKSRQGMFDLVLVICLLYILARIPSWISQMVMRGGMGRSPLARMARTIAAIVIFRGLAGKLKGGRTPAPVKPRMPPPSRPRPPVPPPNDPPSWVQPELPFPPTSPRGTQLQLPINPPPQPHSPQPGWTQLRLPDKTSHPPRWQQTALPIRPRYTQTTLPAPPERRHIQPELPLRFPQPGTPQAGRSPRRLANEAALRDAEARARRRATLPNPPNPARNPTPDPRRRR